MAKPRPLPLALQEENDLPQVYGISCDDLTRGDLAEILDALELGEGYEIVSVKLMVTVKRKGGGQTK